MNGLPITRRLPAILIFLVTVILGLANPTVSAQTPTTEHPWAYLLLHDSSLLDDCPICDRVSIAVPMRGAFNLRLIDENPISARYAVEDIHFTAGDRPYRVTGGGTFEIGGEVAITLKLFLELQIDDGLTNTVCYFTNTTAVPDRLWPMMDITVGQTNGTLTQLYTLRLAAAPVRDIWFSTANSFTASSGSPPATFIEGGDLLSMSGRVVKRNADLFTSVGAFPPVPDLGLDAVDILPGGEIAFSLESDITSNTLGPLQHGDLLSTRGRILYRNQDLLAPFVVQPPAPDVGLDAVQVLDNTEVLFSIRTNIFSEKLGVMLSPGDVLSSSGLVTRDHRQLLARFHPTNAASDFGLDALYAWPSGELWFSTDKGFGDLSLGQIQGGDLLSDQGYIVFRNPELLSTFAPAQSPPDLGLDALYVITDAIQPAPAPKLNVALDPETSNIHLSWQGQGRVFQFERADDVTGLFQPASPIVPDLFIDDIGALTNHAQSYYRLRQW